MSGPVASRVPRQIAIRSGHGKNLLRGKEVGEHVFKDGHSTVRLDIEYEGGDHWVVPLSWFAHGLSMLAENQLPPALPTVQASEDGLAEEFEVVRYLTEKQVKRGGYIWKFHKCDLDDWPSPLHGHDYDKGLKLDAIKGDIYDVGTRKRCKTLKAGDLQTIQAELRASKDYKEAVATLVGNE